MDIHYKTRNAWLAAVAALSAGLAVPALASAQDYDGYCYVKKHDAGTNGLVAGAIIGGLLGNSVAAHGHRGDGTAVGAVVGGAIGNSAGRDSVRCQNGDYYSYQDGYYAPPPAPDGYSVVYYNRRPTSAYYSRVRRHAYSDGYDNGYDDSRDRRYDNQHRQGYYDRNGNWHDQRPNRPHDNW